MRHIIARWLSGKSSKFFLTTVAIGCIAHRALGESVEVSRITGDNQLASVTNSQASSYAIIERGPHHRVWATVTTTTNSQGQLISATNKAYIELATGLHHQNAKGQWVESKENIEAYPGGAIARQGPHQVIFANNLNTAVAIDMQTPDGKRLQSHILGLSYFDTATGNSVLFAEIQDSIGQIVGTNQVVYTNAFTQFKADVRYTYTKAGFEQDVILRQRPPLPEMYGLSSTNTRLQVLTEFLTPPQPVVKEMSISSEDVTASALTDQTLDFGVMKIGRGKAFILGNQRERQGGIPVGKQWLYLEGRHILCEEVTVPSVAADLDQLPLVAQNSWKKPKRYLASKQRVLPAPKLAKVVKGTMKLAKLTEPQNGLVLDYVTLNGSLTDYTFRSDTTYFISAACVISNAVFEGGTVIKFADSGAGIEISGSSNGQTYKTSPYHPAVFTSENDDSVGDVLASSTHNPTTSYNTYITEDWADDGVVQYARFSYAGLAMTVAGVDWYHSGTKEFRNCQFIKCQTCASCISEAFFYNVLASSCSQLVTTGCPLAGQHVTVDACDSIGGGGFFRNSIFTGIPTDVGNISYSHTAVLSDSTGIYQSIGAGNYYLATNSPYRSYGVTQAIDTELLASLKQKTTWPPKVYTNTVISTNLTLGLYARRDTNTAPDIGYHYDPVDYLSSCVISNATLTLTNGAVLAYYGSTISLNAGLLLKGTAKLVSQGSATQRNYLAYYSQVQEQPVLLGSSVASSLPFLVRQSGSLGNPDITLQFTTIVAPVGSQYTINTPFNRVFHSLTLRNCEIYGAGSLIYIPVSDPSIGASLTLQNNLFQNNSFYAYDYVDIYANNNLFTGADTNYTLSFYVTPVSFQNNVFDRYQTFVSADGALHNAYVNNATNWYGDITQSQDTIVTTDFIWQSGPLGDYYQPTDSPLIDVGSTNADQIGLYHYTTLTNQVKETNSIVDIGYHYVAVDTYGNPFDDDGDGIPDYLADSNGNGLVDSGEIPWLLPSPPSISSQPVNLTVIQGSNAIFSVTATGAIPLQYQWYSNLTNLLVGATNVSLTLTNVQPANLSVYSVVISNVAGSVSSSNATLTVMSWLQDSDYDGRSDAQEILDGTDPFSPDSVLPVRLGYWRFDDTNTWAGNAGQIPLLVTNVIGIPSWNTNAASIDSTNPAILTYRDVETNGNANINCRKGTVRFWFKPNWNSGNWLNGLHTEGQLIGLGSKDTTNGWSGLLFDSHGYSISFITQSNGLALTNLTVFINWASNQWHQIVLVYSPTNSALCLDGQTVVTNGTGITCYPDANSRSAGFSVGSGSNGSSQVRGQFEELETFNYPINIDSFAITLTGSSSCRNVVYDRIAYLFDAGYICISNDENTVTFQGAMSARVPSLGAKIVTACCSFQNSVGGIKAILSGTANLTFSDFNPSALAFDDAKFDGTTLGVIPYVLIRNNLMTGVNNITISQAKFLVQNSGVYDSGYGTNYFSIPTTYLGGSSSFPVYLVASQNSDIIQTVLSCIGDNYVYLWTTNSAGQYIEVDYQSRSLGYTGYADNGYPYPALVAAGAARGIIQSRPDALGFVTVGDYNSVSNYVSPVTYNGVACSTANVVNGSYPIWNYERLLSRTNSLTFNQQLVRDALTSAFTDPNYQSTAIYTNNFVRLLDMQVDRFRSEGLIAPFNF